MRKTGPNSSGRNTNVLDIAARTLRLPVVPVIGAPVLALVPVRGEVWGEKEAGKQEDRKTER